MSARLRKVRGWSGPGATAAATAHAPARCSPRRCSAPTRRARRPRSWSGRSAVRHHRGRRSARRCPAWSPPASSSGDGDGRYALAGDLLARQARQRRSRAAAGSRVVGPVATSPWSPPGPAPPERAELRRPMVQAAVRRAPRRRVAATRQPRIRRCPGSTAAVDEPVPRGSSSDPDAARPLRRSARRVALGPRRAGPRRPTELRRRDAAARRRLEDG